MGMFKRIADVFKANVNEALDKAEDPEKMLKQMIIEMEESVNKIALAVASSIANEKGLERKIEKNKRDSDDWEKKATQALGSNREDLARAALGKKQLCDQTMTDLMPIYQQAHATADKLRDQMRTLKTKLDEAKTKQSTLIARSQAAKAQKNISKSLSGMGDDAFGGFDKYEKKIETMESEAEALGMLSDEDVSLDDEFKKLGAKSDVDTDLDALKAKMGMLPKADDKKQLPE